MAGARVQAVSNQSTGSASVTVTITAATAGNLLVAAACVNEAAADKDISNSVGGMTAISLADINNTTKVRGRMFYKVAAGGETTLTFAQASGTADMAAYVMEFSGMATSSPEDQAAENSGSTSPSATGTMGAAVTGAIGVGYIAIVNDNNLTTPAGGYTLEGTIASTNGTAASRVRLAMLYDLSSPSTASGVTQGGSARAYVGQIATFKPLPADITISPAAATATAAANVPALAAAVAPAAATATAAALVPAPRISIAPAAATATAAAIAPSIVIGPVVISPPTAAATAAANVPAISISILPAAATATAAANVPTLVNTTPSASVESWGFLPLGL